MRAVASDPRRYFEYTDALQDAIVLPDERAARMTEELQTFVFVIPKVRRFPRVRSFQLRSRGPVLSPALCDVVVSHSRYYGGLQARAPAPRATCSRVTDSAAEARVRESAAVEFLSRSAALRVPLVRQQLFFPDRRLVQFDCGKLQVGIHITP